MRKRTQAAFGFGIALIPSFAASATDILVFNENAEHDFAQTAATAIDAGGTVVAGAANFNATLTGGTWDVVVVDCPSSIPSGGWVPLITYVNGGGRCVMAFWDWDNNSGFGAPGLPQAFGGTTVGADLSLVDGVTTFSALPAGTAAGIFSGVSMPNNDWHNHWGDDGDAFNLAAGAAGLGSVGGPPVMIRSPNGRAIASFGIDDAGDAWIGDGSAVQLWTNMIQHVLLGIGCPKDINFDGSPGTAAPPATLGPYVMTPFPFSGASGTTASTPSPLGGSVGFAPSLDQTQIGGAWATWSHGYTGDVFTTTGDTVTLTMPPGTGAFYFYVEPNFFGQFEMIGTANDGTTSGPILVEGFAGAQYFGFYAAGGSLSSITITNPGGTAGGFAVGEFGIAPAGQVVFDGSPGTAAPPAMLGPYVMNPFPLVACTGPVSSIPGPGGGLTFSDTLDHYRAVVASGGCPTWGTWSHGYTGDVFFQDDNSVTITLPTNTGAFYLYVEPNFFGVFQFTVQTNDGTSSGSVGVEGSSGAAYFGFYANGGGQILSITITNTDGGAGGFGFGEFAIAESACGKTCPADLNGDGVINGFDLAILLGQWTGAAFYTPCPPRVNADLNGDCKINGFDLAILLGLWGPCSF